MLVNNVMRTLSTSTHTEHLRAEHDFYATDPIAAEWLLKIQPQLNNIYEVACGQGHLAKIFDSHNVLGKASDLIDRGYGSVCNFYDVEEWDGDIVTNPPFSEAIQFIMHALDIIKNGRFACFFLKIQFLEGNKRKKFFIENPPKYVYVSSSRIPCAMNGEFYQIDKNGKSKLVNSATCFAWYIWQKGYKGETILRWFN